MTGLLEGIDVRNITSNYWLLPRSFVFPTIRFQCNGRIQGVRGIAHYNRRYFYNRTLVLNLQVWRQNQCHYVPTGINSNATFSPVAIAHESDSTAPFYFITSQTASFSSALGDASIDVKAGDILAIYLPPRTSYNDNIQFNSIPIALANEFQTSYFAPELNMCWSPTLEKTQCHCGSTIGTPLLALNFVSTTSLPTGKIVTFCLTIIMFLCSCSSMDASIYKFVLWQQILYYPFGVL